MAADVDESILLKANQSKEKAHNEDDLIE